MLITALDTGARQGEMLALRFGDIEFERDRLRNVAKLQRHHDRPSSVLTHHSVETACCSELGRFDADGVKRC
jgi:integrase